jgi:hypothetical protein
VKDSGVTPIELGMGEFSLDARASGGRPHVVISFVASAAWINHYRQLSGIGGLP